jgi:methionine sulfoxide reductase heme-binding subunit
MARGRRSVIALKVLLWIGSLAPAAWLIDGFFRGGLGANPIEKITHVTGMTALVILLLTLAVTPVRRITGWHPVIGLRRPLGLFAFFYVSVHFLVWMGLDLGFRMDWIWEDIVKRPYITAGFTAFLILIPLAITSTRGWIRRLGKKWAILHRGTYLAAGLGLLHYYWLVRADFRLPLTLVAIFALLMAFRVPGWISRWRKGRASGGKVRSGREQESDTPLPLNARGR